MKHFAVIGDPIAHSRSPEIYEPLFAAHGIDADFSKLRVTAAELPDIRSIAAELSGFAVTMPHKKSIIPYLDGLDPSANECGAVNIVTRDGELLIGHNTDGEGLVDAVISSGYRPDGKRVLILGRGGAALSAAYALKKRSCRVSLLVRDRRPETPFSEELIIDRPSRADVFINASPLGMRGMEDFRDLCFLDRIRPELVFDMVYLSDSETRLISEARGRGIPAIDGSRMLYMQALRAFKLFTGTEA